ncbi:MAG TPA: hypothetical protein PKO15_10240 [Fibrobacteria bacterium]|nr:hypothetical protein [Fibrobacteria bacterium]HOX51040.1 hypothetical protein [Fibrobacteria bacterium]
MSVKFACHGGLLRLALPADGSTVAAKCPVCGREAFFRRGTGGSSSTWFEVGP